MQLWGTREQQLIFLNSLGEARPARRATTRRTHRSRWLNPRRSLWHEERLLARERPRALSASDDAHAGASRLRRRVTRDARKGR
jgi:hypothetical protein